MKRKAIVRVMAGSRLQFFEAIRALETAADVAGAESGLQGLGEESFEMMMRATVKRIATETGVNPASAVLIRNREQLQSRHEALQAKLRQDRGAWSSAGEASSASGLAFDWRRLLVCGLIATIIGLYLRLAHNEGRWKTFALLTVSAALFGLGPWRLTARVKAGFVEVAEVTAHLTDCLRAGWVGLRVARLNTEVEAIELQVATLEQWQEAGLDSLMGRFRHQYQRGAAAAKLSNEF
jgi:hypothetical protein